MFMVVSASGQKGETTVADWTHQNGPEEGGRVKDQWLWRGEGKHAPAYLGRFAKIAKTISFF